MSIFSYFDTETINNQEVVDVWKRYSVNVQSEDFQYHDLKENENLMQISNEYYNTIDNWWVLFIFNELYDINFSLLTNDNIDTTVDGILSNLGNINNIPEIERLKTIETVRNFYKENNTLIQAIQMTNESINNISASFLREFETYLREQLLLDSRFVKRLKIPGSDVVFRIKNEFERLSVVWRRNNR